MQTFQLNGREFIELHNLLKVTGLCDSGGVAKLMITAARVTVDDAVELRKRCKIRKGQVVSYAGQQITVVD